MHPSITITITRYSKDILGVDEVMGKYVESIVFEHSKLLSDRIFFWRTPQKEEIDEKNILFVPAWLFLLVV